MSDTLDLSRPVAVTLSLSAWNNVLAIVAERSWREADPLMSAIRRQLAIGMAAEAGASRLHTVPTQQSTGE